MTVLSKPNASTRVANTTSFISRDGLRREELKNSWHVPRWFPRAATWSGPGHFGPGWSRVSCCPLVSPLSHPSAEFPIFSKPSETPLITGLNPPLSLLWGPPHFAISTRAANFVYHKTQRFQGTWEWAAWTNVSGIAAAQLDKQFFQCQ